MATAHADPVSRSAAAPTPRDPTPDPWYRSLVVGRCQREEPDPVLGQDPGNVPVVDRAQEADVGRKGLRISRDGAADRERLTGGQPRQHAHGFQQNHVSRAPT